MNYPALLCISVLLAQLVPAAGRAEPAAGATLPPALEAKIRALDEQEVHAVLAGDVATLERLWSPRILINNPQSGITPTREALLARVREGKIRYLSFERHIEAMRASGEDLVIVMGAEKVVPAGPTPGAGGGGGQAVVLRRFTDLWRLEEGNWTLIARHANVIPNPGP